MTLNIYLNLFYSIASYPGENIGSKLLTSTLNQST